MADQPVVCISKRFRFDSAHRLPAVASEHSCSRLHGHTYTLEVEVKGRVDPEKGWLMDYDALKRAVKPLVAELDHHTLNEAEGLTNTTAEELAVWFWNRLKPRLPMLSRVSVSETPTTRCDYYGEME